MVWLLSAEDGRESGEGEERKLYIVIIIEILHCIVLYIFHFKINTLLCYTVVLVLVLVLVLGIGIARGQYYWILGVLFGIVLTLLKGLNEMLAT